MKEPIPFGLGRFVLFLLVSMTIAAAASAQVHPAVITGTSSGGIGYVTSSGGTSGINADIGRWDTPYPYGQNGPALDGAEPYDLSSNDD